MNRGDVLVKGATVIHGGVEYGLFDRKDDGCGSLMREGMGGEGHSLRLLTRLS